MYNFAMRFFNPKYSMIGIQEENALQNSYMERSLKVFIARDFQIEILSSSSYPGQSWAIYGRYSMPPTKGKLGTKKFLITQKKSKQRNGFKKPNLQYLSCIMRIQVQCAPEFLNDFWEKKFYFYFSIIILQEWIIASLFIIKAILNPFSATFHVQCAGNI